MREVCSLYPLKNGKPSKLYMELYTLTNKDRQLTNLLYALSLQDEITRLFTPSDLNSQGEPNTRVFVEKLKVNDILSERNNLKAKERAIGAIDRRGNRIYYDDMMTITQRVLNFNDDPNNSKVRAVIKADANGFYIEVDTLNSENYNANNSLNSKINLFNSLLQHFNNEGLGTTLSDSSKRILNPINIYYAINTLKGLKRDTSNISPNAAALLADLFSAEPLMSRLKTQFGNDLAQALSQKSGYRSRNPLTFTPTQERQLNDMLSLIQIRMKRIMNTSVIDQMLEDNRTNTPLSSTYMGTDGLSIKQTLNNLYTLYHLDNDKLDILSKKVKTVSDAANKLLQIRLALLEEAKLKGKNVDKSTLERRQKEIEQGNYINSVLKLLKDAVNSVGNVERKINKLERLKNKLEQNPNSLQVIKNISSVILEQLRIADAYEDIVEKLADYDLLENDDVSGNEDTLEDIKDIAEELLDDIRRMRNNARNKQVDAVKAFLKIYWGEEKVMPDGTTVAVTDIMKMAIQDPNIFDRFIYAANTSSDEMMSVIAEAVRQANDRRDAILKKQLREIRTATKELYDSGSNSMFMFELDSEGYPKGKIISDYDYDRMDRELEAYMEQIKNDPNIDKESYDELRKNWIQQHSRSVTYEYTDSKGNTKKLAFTAPIYDAPVSVKDRLTTAQYNYYKSMMDKKAEMLDKIDEVNNNTLFDVIEIANDVTTALQESGGNPTKAFQIVKNKVIDALGQREDDTEYGSILDANNLKIVHVNYKGEEINTLPLFYRHQIKDRSRVSTDFSRSMIAYLAMSQQYIQMNEILDSILLAKDFMLTQRSVAQSSGKSIKADMQKLGKKVYVDMASKMGAETDLKGLADDFFEKAVFGKVKKDEGYLWGTKIRLDKAIDTLTGYTSITGLVTNLLGGQANLLVGKLQMLIEAGLGFGGEFFNMKDLFYADVEYFHMLPELLLEVNSNVKSSKLGLLMQEFNALDDFYERIKETGFYDNPISKIIGNTNLFFLYGIGEHLLHAQGMIAVLHNKNNVVLNDKGEKVPLIEAFDVVKDNTGNGELIIKQGYTQVNGEAIDEVFMNKIKSKVRYANSSMHGAYDTFSKGMIHRYAVGRLIMNFRQWMPAHYQRRFRGLYYNADLGEYREGYYVSTYKFLKGCVDDLVHAKFQIATRWGELSDMERYNLRRAMAETTILAIITALIALAGDYKDRKGNWAYRNLIYQLKRMQMETFASTPLNPARFIKSAVKVLNSPAAALNTVEDLADLLRLTDVFVTIQDGKYEGENKYLHNLEKRVPFYSKLRTALDIDEVDDAFKLFNY